MAARGISVVVSDEHGRRLAAAGLSRWLARVAPRRARGRVSVAVISDARVRALNRRYRRRDAATDVLSFPYAPDLKVGPTTRGTTTRGTTTRGTTTRGTTTRGTTTRGTTTRGTTGAMARAAATRPRRPELQLGRLPSNPPSNPQSLFPNPCLGDIVIARGVARRQARASGHDERTELRILALHGLLHLLGYDHNGDDGAMARMERRLRRKGGLREGLIERSQP